MYKKKTNFVFLLLLCLSVFYFGFGPQNTDKGSQSPVFDNKVQDGKSNPDLSRWYFDFWYRGYGEITPELQQRWADQVNSLPVENTDAVNNWISWGPYGQRIWGAPTTENYAGRIVDIEVDGTPSTRLAAASGGIWGFAFIVPIPLSDNLTSTLNLGSFDSKSGDANTILVGTGEPYTGLWGTGLYRTTDGGTSFTNIPMSPTPAAFYKLRYAPNSTTVVHAATTSGYFRSTDGGSTWSRTLIGNVTDVAVNPSNTNIIYAPNWNDGLYKSTNAGVTWTKLTSGGIPTSNVGRTTVSIAASNPQIVYVNMAKNSDNNTLGVYKTTNDGTSWTTVTPVAEFHWGQGWYNTLCGVSPTDPNKIIVGGGALYRSNNGGSSWTAVNEAHADQHCITWNSTGTSVWVGNDGGMMFSADAGITWSTSANFCPITQYVIFDVHPDGNYCYGGSQDNGISGTSNRGTNWYHFLGGDGGGAAIDKGTPSTIYMTNGVYGGNWAFQRIKTTNSGQSWSGINTGVDPSGDWYHRIRSDNAPPIYLFNNSGPYVYESQNAGASWFKSNASAFPCSSIYNLSVANYTSDEVIYACLNNDPVTANKLRVLDGGTWFERSTGFPAGSIVRNVKPHPTNNNIAYAVINGSAPGNKIFKTTNRGTTWTNITGDMPDIPLADIVPHPTNSNVLFLGSNFGCYKTINSGTNWIRWNYGMPNATIISEMGYIDSIAANGKYYVVSATYGRAIYYREIQGTDPIGIVSNNSNIPKTFTLSQNYPNPFNPTTKIKFGLPTQDYVSLGVYDITGRLVAQLLNGDMKAGTYTYEFEGTDLSSGVYFYKLKTSKFTDTKKMILVK